MDKVLQLMGGECEVTVTNDGATILKSLHIDIPAAEVLVGTSQVVERHLYSAGQHQNVEPEIRKLGKAVSTSLRDEFPIPKNARLCGRHTRPF